MAAQRQSPVGLSVGSFTIAPNQRWLTAWTQQGPSSYLVSALGIDLSVAPDRVRGSTLARGSTVLGIQDAFATLLVGEHTRILLADGTIRDPWGDQPSYVAATSKQHLVVRLNTDPQATELNAVLVDVSDTTHEKPLPMMARAWISPDDQWLVYKTSETSSRMRAMDVASGAVTELQTADGKPLPGDGDDPVFASDGKLAVVPTPRTVVDNNLVCGALYVVTRGDAHAQKVGGGKTDHVCGFFVAPDGKHIALGRCTRSRLETSEFAAFWSADEHLRFSCVCGVQRGI